MDREWSVEVRDLLDEEIFPDSVLMIEEGNNSIEGKGRTLTMPTFLEEGLWIITANVDDNSFILQPQVLEGDCESRSAFNEFEMDADNLEIETTYRVPEDGCIIFWEVSNVDAMWQIAFDKLR